MIAQDMPNSGKPGNSRSRRKQISAEGQSIAPGRQDDKVAAILAPQGLQSDDQVRSAGFVDGAAIFGRGGIGGQRRLKGR